jgi:hypothetical protein
MLRAVASGSRLLPTRPVKDFHLQSSAHAGHTFTVETYAPRTAASTLPPVAESDRTPMSLPHLHIYHEQFPGIPAKALEFFHPRNALKAGSTLRARTVYDFAMHLAIPTGDTTSSFPMFHRLNLILQRMADLNMQIVVHRGDVYSMNAAYFCALTDAQIASVQATINYAVYGFP